MTGCEMFLYAIFCSFTKNSITCKWSKCTLTICLIALSVSREPVNQSGHNHQFLINVKEMTTSVYNQCTS